MLKLDKITKEYVNGKEVTKALNGIPISFADVGFTSVLGPSGCGKTTLLNIIGGLDKYTSGDLLIDDKSTKDFKDKDWDSYRNARIGFVFQSYNLISHLSILENVSMALSLSGIPSKQRKEKAKESLIAVGLDGMFNKKPNQLSGGQVQRVAIARALINNPDIVLADEPTGALDSKTCLQVMDILKDVSKKRLVIMVTHNKELATQYSDRIIEMKDGLIVSDDKPEIAKDSVKTTKMVNKKTSMSYLSALTSSFKNLLSKKGRTIITSIAGSIGIIGVALVLAISSGMTSYIAQTERDSLAGFPISISQSVSTDMTQSMNFNKEDANAFPTDNVFYPYDSTANISIHKNNITAEYVDYVNAMDSSYYSAISNNYSVSKNIVSKNSKDEYLLVNATSGSSMFSSSYFSQLPDNPDFIKTQYDVLAGTYPSSSSDLALIVDEDNHIESSLLEAFGIDKKDSFAVDDLLNKSFKVITNDDFYSKAGEIYVPNSDYKTMYNSSSSLTITITSIMRVKQSASSQLLSTGLNYSTSLTNLIFQSNLDSSVVQAQKENPDTNVLTGSSFTANITYETIMKKLGGDKTPSSIQVYPKTFDEKAKIKEYLTKYNQGKEDADKIIYSDLSETVTSMISSLVNTVSTILVAFAAISLVVSTVMIGIITYVSVVERTKEIGIMRAIGARKKDVSRIFSAEALIIGFASGVFGILLTYILCIPASALISSLIGVSFTVLLPGYDALILIILSMVLTLIAGFFPSKIAAKEDPVVALRTD